MKKLYEVETELYMYVMAEDKYDAAGIARKNVSDEADNLSSHNFAVSVPVHYMADWEDSVPYGSDTDQTVKEIFKAEKEVAKKQADREKWEKRQLKMFT